jgi:hypothetical protein
MNMQRRRGRPLTFEEPLRLQLADLIRKHGIRGAKAIATTPICKSTLSKIAAEFAIQLKPGRRTRVA